MTRNHGKSMRAIRQRSFFTLILAVFISFGSVAALRADALDQLDGFWSGEAVEVDDSGKEIDRVYAAMDFYKVGEERRVLLTLASLCSVVQNVTLEDKTLSFDWSLHEDMRLSGTVEGDTISMDVRPRKDLNVQHVVVKKAPIVGLTDKELTGAYKGKLKAALRHPSLKDRDVYTVSVTLDVNGESASGKLVASMAATGEKGAGIRPRSVDLPFKRIERYGDRFFLYTETPEDAEKYKQEVIEKNKSSAESQPERISKMLDRFQQEVVCLHVRPGGKAEAMINVRRLGTAVGTLEREEPKDKPS